MEDSGAAITKRGDLPGWRAWTQWARANGLSEIPASGTSVAAYITELAAAGASRSIIQAAKSAISSSHRHAGFWDPTLGYSIDHSNVGSGDALERHGEGVVLSRLVPRAAGSAGCIPSKFLRNLRRRQSPSYSTDLGEAWVGDSRQLLKKIDSESIDLVITSPPYGLVKQKAYGNQSQEDYVRWFRPFAREIFRVLKPEGSFVLNVAGAWQKGQPTRALYPYRLVLDLCEPSLRRKDPPKFFLAQEFYWLNPAKIPNPVQWANVKRERVKDAVEPIWWFSKSPHPKANNRNVLVPYSDHMQRLLKTGKYNIGARPSGWNISKVWGKDNGGAIPSNFEADDALDFLFNVLVVSNTASNDSLRKSMRKAGNNAHPAMFPTALPEFFVRMLTNEGDVVLDPFSGSNATGWVADRLGRRWVSIDVDPEYVENSRLRWPLTTERTDS